MGKKKGGYIDLDDPDAEPAPAPAPEDTPAAAKQPKKDKKKKDKKVGPLPLLSTPCPLYPLCHYVHKLISFVLRPFGALAGPD